MTNLRATTNSARGRNNKARAKQDERDVALVLGGRRFEADTGHLLDVEHPEYAIQVKGGATVTTAALRDGLAQAVAGAVGTTLLRCVVLVDRRGSRIGRYVVFELGVFVAHHGYGPKEEIT